MFHHSWLFLKIYINDKIRRWTSILLTLNRMTKGEKNLAVFKGLML